MITLKRLKTSTFVKENAAQLIELMKSPCAKHRGVCFVFIIK